MKLKRLSQFVSATLLSISSLFVINMGTVLAAADTCTWTGATNNTFNDAGNWTGCDNGNLPENGDILEFDVTSLSANETLTNDIVGLSVAGINVIGSNSNGYGYEIGGTEAITMTGNISVSHNTTISTDIVLGASISVTGTSTLLVNSGSDLDLVTYDLTVSSYLSINGTLSGSGDITVDSGSYFNIYGNNTFSGAILVNGGLDAYPYSVANSSGITIANTGRFYASLYNVTGIANYTVPITFNGDSNPGDATSTLYVSFGPNTGTVSFASVTLTDNITYDSYAKADQQTEITATLGGNSVTRLAGSQGKLTVNGTAIDSVAKTTSYGSPTYDYSGTPSDWSIGDKNISIFNSQSPSYNMTVQKGGVLKGTGKVGTVTVESGGTVAPGTSPGCLSTGNLIEGGTYTAELGGTTVCTEYDQLTVTGTVNVTNGTLTTSFVNGFKPTAGNSFTIISNDGTDAVTGTFTGLAEGATFTVDGVVLKISYVGGDGNDVVLTAQATPGTPNTGFALITTNPLVTLTATSLLAAGLVLVSRRYNRQSAKK